MARPSRHLVIDARPRGPSGPLAVELIQGRSVLAHLLDVALAFEDQSPVVVHARLEEHRRLQHLLGEVPPERIHFVTGPPSEAAAILRADRLYDLGRLRRALRRGRDPESAVLWRLDQPHGLVGAEAELTRRQSYQPLGRYWALAPARALARVLQPTPVRPNGLTLASAGLMLSAALVVALASSSFAANALTAAALALALVLDTADGHLARLQGTATGFGRWLDATLDELADMALHAAIAWGAYVRDEQPIWLVLGMVYGMGKYLFTVTAVPVPDDRTAAALVPVNESTTAGSRGLNRLVAAVHLIGHADIRWHLWIALAICGRLDAALAAYAVYFPARALAGGLRKAVRHA